MNISSVSPQHKKLSRRVHQDDNIVGLRKWLDEESHSMYFMTNQDELLLRKTTVAYGIVEILRSAKLSVHKATAKDLEEACHIDNFSVCLAGKFNDIKEDADRIVGIDMITPCTNLKMITPFFTRGECYGDQSKGELLFICISCALLFHLTNDIMIHSCWGVFRCRY